MTKYSVCSVGLNLFRILATYRKLVFPEMVKTPEAFLKCSLDWTALDAPLVGHELALFKPLSQRIDYDAIHAMIEVGKRSS